MPMDAYDTAPGCARAKFNNSASEFAGKSFLIARITDELATSATGARSFCGIVGKFLIQKWVARNGRVGGEQQGMSAGEAMATDCAPTWVKVLRRESAAGRPYRSRMDMADYFDWPGRPLLVLRNNRFSTSLTKPGFKASARNDSEPWHCGPM